MNKNNDTFCIKNGYKVNTRPQYSSYNDNNSYQPELYELAFYLAERSNAEYIIDIGGANWRQLKREEAKFKIIVVDFNLNLGFSQQQINIHHVIKHNLENGLPSIDRGVLENSVVVVSDVIQYLQNPDPFLKDLSTLSKVCRYLLITTPDRDRTRGVGDFGPPLNKNHVREWNIDEFNSLMSRYSVNKYMIGYTINTHIHEWKNTILVVSGTEAYAKPTNEVSVLAIINTYNEEDIIAETINHLLLQGIDVKIIDNWSTDKTYEIVRELSESSNRITVERYPDKPTEFYQWGKLLENVENLSSKLNYDWFIHYDADEIRESPWVEYNLRQAISFVDYCGYNAIDFTVLDFRPINSAIVTNNHEDNLKFFEFGKRNGHFVQIKCWKKNGNVRVNLSESGGHEAFFSDRRVYPIKFLTKHYPLRNKEQALKKIFMDRNCRISPEEKSKGWHTQYNSFTGSESFEWDKSYLIPWNRSFFISEYLVERISGIGIRRSGDII
ncbi:glycosyltransferase [Paenibacillus ihbetae]|uniref:Glycosyltransferase 2-like domain-containing protein n=1 Tax=Paenibacillus ihbetae TaxID=1870820 RepID=A0ABX3K2S3_9BACL|nr:glycosyltransferase family 2 protein [Paenibacillus ihbetae]OOC63691.1 hypothetical protein BBD40_18645 [Paenibacillus ihbetae]